MLESLKYFLFAVPAFFCFSCVQGELENKAQVNPASHSEQVLSPKPASYEQEIATKIGAIDRTLRELDSQHEKRIRDEVQPFKKRFMLMQEYWPKARTDQERKQLAAVVESELKAPYRRRSGPTQYQRIYLPIVVGLMRGQEFDTIIEQRKLNPDSSRIQRLREVVKAHTGQEEKVMAFIEERLLVYKRD